MFCFKWVGLLALLFSLGSFAERLDLSQGAMTAGGSALIRYNSPDISDWNTDYLKLGVSTNWGFFLMKDFALVFDVQLAGQISSGFDKSRLYQFGTGVLYALDLDSNLYPYGQMMTHAAYVQSEWSAGFTSALGLLVGLTSQVALDFGVSARFDFSISREGPIGLDIGTGYFGVRAFF
jgi:hypothetical protein